MEEVVATWSISGKATFMAGTKAGHGANRPIPGHTRCSHLNSLYIAQNVLKSILNMILHLIDAFIVIAYTIWQKTRFDQ